MPTTTAPARPINTATTRWSNSDILDAARARCLPDAHCLGTVMSAVVHADGTCSWAVGECLPTPRTEVLRSRNYRTGETHLTVFGADRAKVRERFDLEFAAAKDRASASLSAPDPIRSESWGAPE